MAAANWSDRRLKENVQRTGTSASGVTWTYTAEATKHGVPEADIGATFSGTMAQDLLSTPFADAVVTTASGFYAVDYSQLDVPCQVV